MDSESVCLHQGCAFRGAILQISGVTGACLSPCCFSQPDWPLTSDSIFFFFHHIIVLHTSPWTVPLSAAVLREPSRCSLCTEASRFYASERIELLLMWLVGKLYLTKWPVTLAVKVCLVSRHTVKQQKKTQFLSILRTFCQILIVTHISRFARFIFSSQQIDPTVLGRHKFERKNCEGCEIQWARTQAWWTDPEETKQRSFQARHRRSFQPRLPLWPPALPHLCSAILSSLHPLQLSSPPPPLSTPRLSFALFSQTRAQTHPRHHQGDRELQLRTKAVSTSNPRALTKSGRKGEIDEDGFGRNGGEKWDRGSRYSPTPPTLSQWWHHGGQRPFKLRRWLSAISSVWDWRIPWDFDTTKFFFFFFQWCWKLKQMRVGMFHCVGRFFL